MTHSVAAWVDESPNDWTRGRIKNLIASATNGTWGSDPVGDGADVHCIRAADFNRTARRAQLDGAPLRSIDTTSLRKHLLHAGDLILEKSGGGERQPVGMAILFVGDEAAVCSNFCARVTPAQGVDSRYLAYVFAAAYGQGLTQSAIKQTTGIQNLDTSALFSSAWAYPHMGEQRRLADFLDAETTRIDRLVSARERQGEVLAERYATAVSEMVTPGISHDGERSQIWPWLPLDVPTVRLGHLARVQTGVTVHGSREATIEDVERPYLRVANVQGEQINLDEVKTIVVPASMARRSSLRDGDVVMTEANGNPNNLGRGAVWRDEIPGMIHQNHIFAIRVSRGEIHPEYLAALLASKHGRQYFRFTATQVGIATTSSSKVLDFPVPIASREQQEAVVRDYVAVRESAVRAKGVLESQLALLAERRQALITAAVTGKLDVTTARPAHDRDL